MNPLDKVLESKTNYMQYGVSKEFGIILKQTKQTGKIWQPQQQ